jgi:hypothetical protein
LTALDVRDSALTNTKTPVLHGVTLRNRYEERDVMTAKVISLCDYRKSKDAEKRSKNVRGLGFPDDFSPFVGYDDQPEDFGTLELMMQFDEPIQGISLITPDEEETE